MIILTFAFCGFTLSANTTDPKILNAPEPAQKNTGEKTEYPCIYCGVCNGKTFCAIAPTCGQASELFLYLCEQLGCC